MWMGWKVLIGVPYDVLVSGYGGRVVNVLRLYSARSSLDFDMRIFNDGDYFKAVEQKIASETISKVLYPDDAVIAGKELRLVQEYFLAACAVRDTVRRYEQNHDSFGEFPEKVAIQLNDTHPALAVVELMRVLVDEKALDAHPRLTSKPAARASQVDGVTPRSRSLNFCTRPVGVRGRSSTNSTKRGTKK